MPGTRAWRRRRQLKRFFSKAGFASHNGVFETFEEARQFLPRNEEFDSGLLAESYSRGRLDRVFAYDHPEIYWLGEAFRRGARKVFDIGGSVGVHYYAYRRYLAHPESLEWEICEILAAVRAGRRLALQEEVRALTFTEERDTRRLSADVWISAGAIQYLEHGRPAPLLKACQSPPSFIILNKLPLYGGEDFVSTQNIIDRQYAPVYVYNRARFIHEIEAVGYALADSWKVADRDFRLPDQPERSFPRFSGLCFERRYASRNGTNVIGRARSNAAPLPRPTLATITAGLPSVSNPETSSSDRFVPTNWKAMPWSSTTPEGRLQAE